MVGKTHVPLAHHGLETLNFVRYIITTSKTLPQVILKTAKLRDHVSQLKCPVPVFIRNSVVYSITCSGCDALHVGQKSELLTTRLDKHCRRGAPGRKHFETCGASSNEIRQQSRIVDSAMSVDSLLTLDALHVGDLQPEKNTKDEFRSKTLMLRMGQFETTFLIL